MNCEKCKDTGYIEVEVTHPISFLPNIGYVTKQKQICKECSDVRDNTKRSGNVEISSANGRSVSSRRI